MKVSTRLAAGTGLVLVLLLGVLVYQGAQVGRLARATENLAHSGLAASRLALEEIHDLDELEQVARKARVTSDADYLRGAAKLAAESSQRCAEISAHLLEPEVRKEAALLAERLRPVIEETPELLTSVDEASYFRRLRAAQEQAVVVLTAAERAMDRRATEAQEAAYRARLLSVLVSGIAMVLSIVVLVTTARSIQRPLNQLAAATRAVAQGRFDQRLELSSRDEFGRVSEDFNVMVQRLGDLDQMKKDILSQVSHELKAPLTGMQETAQLLLEGVPGPLTPDQRRLLELDVESARRLSGMISKMLDLARLDAGVSSCDLGTVDLITLLRNAAEVLEPGGRTRGVTLRLELPQEAVGVWGDRDRLFQVAANLIENACKFSPPGAEVVLTAAVVPDLPVGAPAWALGPLFGSEGAPLVRVTVADRGLGVPEEEKVRIFERFHQVRREGRSRLGGVGLGLAICRDIVAAHGGALWVSDRPGGGSVFTLCLRSASAPPPVAL